MSDECEENEEKRSCTPEKNLPARKRVKFPLNESSDDENIVVGYPVRKKFKAGPKTPVYVISSGSDSDDATDSDSEVIFSPKARGQSYYSVSTRKQSDLGLQNPGCPSLCDASSKSKVFSKFSQVEVKSCEGVPCDIDGTCAYVVPLDPTLPKIAAVKDGRPWGPDSSTNWAGFKKKSVRYSNCAGGSKCVNVKCLFWSQSGYPNQTQFEKNDGSICCRACGHVAAKTCCPARRYIVCKETSATIYHQGEHTCTAVKPRELVADKVKGYFKENPKVTPSQLSTMKIANAIKSGEDWEKIEEDAKPLLDKKWVSNLKQSAKSENGNHNQDSMESVIEFKKQCDKHDTFYVYKLNLSSMNPDKPDFVFKTSTNKVKMLLHMNQGSGHFLEDEHCFFDGKSGKLKHYKTLTLSVYHPLLRKQIALAIMDCPSENTPNVQLFFELVNECMQKVSGDKGKMFNPLGICTDMAGCNRQGLVNVYGNSFLKKFTACAFHFKNCRNRHRMKLGTSEAKERFTYSKNPRIRTYNFASQPD